MSKEGASTAAAAMAAIRRDAPSFQTTLLERSPFAPLGFLPFAARNQAKSALCGRDVIPHVCPASMDRPSVRAPLAALRAAFMSVGGWTSKVTHRNRLRRAVRRQIVALVSPSRAVGARQSL